MSELYKIQNSFFNYLEKNDSDLQRNIISTDKVPADIRLLIYKNAYKIRLIEALAANYPILSKYLGEETFEKMASEYILQYPSPYNSIRWFGDQLAHFLSHNADKAYPYLSELAEFEWIQTLVFDAADSSILQIETVAKVPPEDWANMHLVAHPSLYRANFSWNIVAIWESISDDKEPESAVENTLPIPWVFWRQDLLNRFRSLSADEAWAIDAVLRGASFSEICEGLCTWIDEENAGMRAASLLKGWIETGILKEIK